MHAEVVAIGTELLTGRNLDTNSQWLSRQLAELGIVTRYHSTVGDDLADMVSVFAHARDRADLVVITGGLGPTQDDLTRDALAQLAGVELVFHEPVFEQIRQMFAIRNRPMPERNRLQAMLPAGAEALANTVGTAPGMWLEVARARATGMCATSDTPLPHGHALFISMPGVPREMFEMFEKQVKPRLRAWAGTAGVLIERKINTFGAGESAIEEKLLDLTRRGHEPEVGITVSDMIVSLRILARAADADAADRLIEPVARIIYERLGELVFGEGDDDLHDVVARMLRERKQTIAVAESLTGGLIGTRLTLVPGVSENFMGGICAYDNRIKRDLLGVPQELLDRHGAVSPEVAEAMAAGCRERFGTDWAVSTTGIAGPGGGSAEKPVGLVYCGLASPTGTVRHLRLQWFGTRHEIQSRTARSALNWLRLEMGRGAGTSSFRQ